MRRVLKHADASLNTLPSQWLQQLLARVSEPGQSRDDIIRRSAGLPPAFMSIFLAEPQGTHKHLLHIGLSGLLVTAGMMLRLPALKLPDLVRCDASQLPFSCHQTLGHH